MTNKNIMSIFTLMKTLNSVSEMGPSPRLTMISLISSTLSFPSSSLSKDLKNICIIILSFIIFYFENGKIYWIFDRQNLNASSNSSLLPVASRLMSLAIILINSFSSRELFLLSADTDLTRANISSSKTQN